MFLNVTQSL